MYIPYFTIHIMYIQGADSANVCITECTYYICIYIYIYTYLYTYVYMLFYHTYYIHAGSRFSQCLNADYLKYISYIYTCVYI